MSYPQRLVQKYAEQQGARQRAAPNPPVTQQHNHPRTLQPTNQSLTSLVARARSPQPHSPPAAFQNQNQESPPPAGDVFPANEIIYGSPNATAESTCPGEAETKIDGEQNGRPASAANFIAAGYIKGYVVGKKPIGYTRLYTAYDCENARQASVQVIAKDQRLEYCGTELPLLNTLREVPGLMSTLEILEHGDSLLVFKEACWLDMHSHLREVRRQTEDVARELFVQIVRTVAACHAHNIILRDLKLNNIVFATPACTVVKFTSLDLACAVQEDNDLLFEHSSALSPAYVAPECLSGRPYSGKKADSWSLGVILYAMIVGTYPFIDESPQKLQAKISAGKYTVPNSVSATVRCLLSSLLCTDPSARPIPAEILRHPFLARAATSTQNYNYDYKMAPSGGLAPGGFDHFALSDAAQRCGRRAGAGPESDDPDQMVPDF